jgi:hypothetical protein
VNLPDDPWEFVQGALVVAMVPLVIWVCIQYLLRGFRPRTRVQAPRAGKLTKSISPRLQAFVAALPRPSGDALAEVCQPILPGTLPFSGNMGYVTALLPLWKSGPKYSVAVRSWSRRQKERTEFVRLEERGDDWDVRALTEQGFIADTLIELMKTLDWNDRPAFMEGVNRAAETLGFRHLGETVEWFSTWQPHDEDGRSAFIRAIDKRNPS